MRIVYAWVGSVSFVFFWVVFTLGHGVCLTVMYGLRVGIGDFVRTLAKTLVDPMLDAGNWA